MATKPTSPLLGEFSVPSLSAWQQEVERLLKGAPFAKRMFTRTGEGITVNPLYTALDTDEIPWRDTLPGQAPFVRGNRAAGYHAAPWLVAQENRHPDPVEFNRRLRLGLAAGQTAANLVLTAGVGPGERGTDITDPAQLAAALSEVDLSAVPLILQTGPAPDTVSLLTEALAELGCEARQLAGCVGYSPIAAAVGRGGAPVPVAELGDDQFRLTRWALAEAPGLRTLPIAEKPWHEGGADLALSLGLSLAEAVAVLRALEKRGLDPAEAAPRIQFNLEIGGDFFLELAKLRALRLAWSRLLVAVGLEPSRTTTFIHARTARRTQTVLDPEVNLLRATTQAMSAVLGGTDSLCVRPFDEVLRQPDEFSERLARNVHLLLAHECHFDQVADPAGGAWYVESLTRDLASAAWNRFQAVERLGGLADAVESGWVQEQVAAAAAERAAGYATRRSVLVGTNMYPVAAAGTPAVTQADGDGSATLSAVPVAAVPPRRDGEAFERLRERTARLAETDPAATRIYTACLGDFARYMPRLEFTRGFCQVGGFTVTGDSFHDNAKAAVKAAVADGARTVVLVGRDETYGELAADVAAGLRGTTSPPRVVLAGAPGERAAAWRAAGIESFIHLGCDAVQTLNSWLPAEEVQS